MNSLRRRLLELAVTFGSFLSPHGLSAQGAEFFTLLEVGQTGELSINSGRIDPSLATPAIIFSKCIASVRRSADGENFEGEIEVEGMVRSALCDSLPSAKAVISQLTFTISEDMKFKERTIEVQGEKMRDDSILRPFPFEGHFAAVLKGIPVTSGNNVFYFRAKDPLSNLTAESVWAASFDLPYEDDEDEEEASARDRTKQLEPKVTSAAAEIDSASGLDPIFYCIGLPVSEGDREVALGQAGEKWYPLKVSSTLPNLVVPIDPDTGRPLLVTLAPGGIGKARDYWNRLSAQKDFIPLQGRDRFLAAFYQGLLSNGITLSAGGVTYVENLSFLEESGRCGFPVRIREGGKIRPATLSLPLEFKEGGFADHQRLADLLWIWRDMIIRKDPKLEDFEIGLICGDLTPSGVEDIYLRGWTSDFMSWSFEAMETILKEGLKNDDLGEGAFSLGIVAGQAMRVAFEMRGEGSKAEFLKRLAMRF